MSMLATGLSSLYSQASNFYNSSGIISKTLMTTATTHVVYSVADTVGKKIHQYTGFSLYNTSDCIQGLFRKYSEWTVKPLVEAFHGLEAGVAMNRYMSVVINHPESLRLQDFVKKFVTDPIVTTCAVGPVVEELAFRAPMLLMDDGVAKNVYMVASSIIFALSHEKSLADTDEDGAGRALALAAMGLAFAYVTGGADSFTMEAVNNLGVATLSHCLYNFTNWLVK